MESTRFAIIGAGLAGAATAWQLARRGHEVQVFERSTPANRWGSSHGSARIFRYAYANPFYARLVVDARAEWDELERMSGQRLITPVGAVDFGAGRDPAALAAILEAAGVEHELLTGRRAGERWPGIVFDTDVLWHPGAGVIDAETSVLTMLRLAEEAGAAVHGSWPVESVIPANGHYRVTAQDGRAIEADRVIVSAGGWLPELLERLPLPAAFRAAIPPITVMQEQVYHFPYRGGEANWPTFIHKSPGMQVYGLPGGRDAGFRGQKVAEYNGGTRLPSAGRQNGRISPANRARVVDYVARTLPGLDPEPFAETTCLFTNTPTEDFILDGRAGITILSPCSGHGAKFAPLIGRIAADVALGVASAPAPFRLAA